MPSGGEHRLRRPVRQRAVDVQLRRGLAHADDLAVPGSRRPGALSHFDLARKDCLGTARNTTSKVWYTVANGVLSDVYYPTVDNTNVETLQYVVTDGSTFTDLQTRDMTYRVEPVHDAADGVPGHGTAKNGRYRIVTDYVTDPSRNTVLMRVRVKPRSRRPATTSSTSVRSDRERQRRRRRGQRRRRLGDHRHLDRPPVLVASDTVTATNAANRDYAQPVFAALDGAVLAVTAASPATASDGLVQLDAAHALTPDFDAATTATSCRSPRSTLAPGRQDAALPSGSARPGRGRRRRGGLARRRASTRRSTTTRQGWTALRRRRSTRRRRSCRPRASQRPASSTTSTTSAPTSLKASEDKTFPGAIVASLASPWGQAVSAGDPANTYFGSYREVFARDLYEAWTGLVAAGDLATARDATLFLFERQQLADGSMPRNSLVNGKIAPDSFGTQLDEVPTRS